MFKARRSPTPSSFSSAEVADCELSFEELTLVLGGQTHQQPPSTEPLENQAKETVNSIVELVAPVARPFIETGKLVLETLTFAHDYGRYLAEHSNSTPLTDQQAKDAAAKHAADAQHKADAQKADQNHLLQSDHPTTPQQVQDWLDATNAPAPQDNVDIPSNMTDGGSGHTPEIVIEPVEDDSNGGGGGGYHPG